MSPIQINDLIILDKLFSDFHTRSIVLAPENLLADTTSKHPFILCQRPQDVLAELQKYASSPIILYNLSQGDISEIVQQSHIRTIVDFTHNKKSIAWIHSARQMKQTSFSYINNPDGTMRWIYPSASSYPSFLNLYNSSGKKARFYKWGIQTAFQFHVQRLFRSGQFKVWHQIQLPLKNWLSDFQYEDYSIFTGTVGANRKVIVECSTQGNSTHFIKMPLGEQAQEIVDTEYQILQRVGQLELTKLEYPSATRIRAGVIQNNIRPSSAFNSIDLDQRHLDALFELYHQTHSCKRLITLDSWKRIAKNIQQSLAIKESKNAISLEKIATFQVLLERLYKSFDSSDLINIGMAHGDFTPWNMYVSANKIHLYDWELAEQDMPLLFDAFHFIFQSNILIQYASFEQIQEKIARLQQEPIVQDMIESFGLDFELSYRFYILYIASYYFPIYTQQEQLHTQAHWLMDIWEASLQEYALLSIGGGRS